jgi:hypothetical protein
MCSNQKERKKEEEKRRKVNREKGKKNELALLGGSRSETATVSRCSGYPD